MTVQQELAPADVSAGTDDGLFEVRRSATSRRLRAATVVPIVVAILVIAGLGGWMLSSGAQARAELYASQVAQFEEATGIRVLRVVLTAGGGIVELQYQVLDPDKALAVHDAEAPPGLIDEKTGAVVAVPFHDHADRVLHTAVTYRQMFMNGGGVLERGSQVTLSVGDSIIQHIEVG